MNVLQKIKVALLCGLSFFSYTVTDAVLTHQFTSDEIRVKNFYRMEKNSLDMVLIGASTAFTDYSAPYAWKERGITSYSFATNMAPMGLAKPMLKEARKTQKPKLFIVDINGVLYNDELETKEGSLRLFLDNMKFSINKVETVKELVPKENRASFYIPFLKYHENWEKINESIEMSKHQLENMFDKNHLSIAGMEGNSKMDPQYNSIDISKYPNATQMYKKSGDALIDLLEYCKKEDIKNIVFTNMPRYYSQKMIHQRGVIIAAGKAIESYGYKFYDFDEYVDEIGLDPLTDFYNTNHLNIYGQRKFTTFMIDTIQNDYDMKSEHEPSIIEHWDKEYKSYEKVYKFVDEKAQRGEAYRYNFSDVSELIH